MFSSFHIHIIFRPYKAFVSVVKQGLSSRHCLGFSAVAATPTIIATTVKPWAKIRALISSWDCRVLPRLKALRPQINAPAVPKQPEEEDHREITAISFDCIIQNKNFYHTYTFNAKWFVLIEFETIHNLFLILLA